MAKKVVSDILEEIKKLLADGQLILGADKNLKLLRSGKMKKLFLAKNCSEELRADVQNLCEIGNVECVDLDYTSEEIGTRCKKPFNISIIGVAA